MLIRKSGLLGSVVGLSLVFWVDGNAGARDVGTSVKTQKSCFVQIWSARVGVSFSAHQTADTLLKECLVLSKFKSSLVRALQSKESQ